MHHVKLIVFGIVLLVGVVFGSIFWGDFSFNQQEISNTPLPPSPAADIEINTIPAGSDSSSSTSASSDLSASDSFDEIEEDLDDTDLESIDSDSSELEAEINAL